MNEQRKEEEQGETGKVKGRGKAKGRRKAKGKGKQKASTYHQVSRVGSMCSSVLGQGLRGYGRKTVKGRANSNGQAKTKALNDVSGVGFGFKVQRAGFRVEGSGVMQGKGKEEKGKGTSEVKRTG